MENKNLLNYYFLDVFKRLSTIKDEVGDATKLSRQLGYRPPAVLRKRSDTDSIKKEKVFHADT